MPWGNHRAAGQYPFLLPLFQLNRLKKVTQAEGTPSEAATEYQYDRKDNLTQVKDATNKITTYKYDDMARLVETTSPDTGTTIYTYDAAGNLISKTDAKGITVTYTYDALNRLTKTNFPADPDIDYTYDEQDVTNGKGRLTTLANTASSLRYYYDERGNITEVQFTADPGTCGALTYTTEYTYNDNNELLSINYPSGRIITYDRNDIGNITGVDLSINQTPQTIADNFSYEPFGSVKGLSYANSIQTAIIHNNKYQITGIQEGTVVNRTYTHDFEGNIKSIKPLDTLPQPSITATTNTYTYVTGKDWIQQITNGGTHSYTYDANGNITNDGIRTYVYNQDNRLTQVTKAGVTGQYTYNGVQQRIKKVTGGTTTVYHYDLLGNLIEETDQNGTLQRSYIYAGEQRIAQVAANNNIFYYHNDHLGTPLAVTNGSGTIVWQAAYNTFGNATVDGGSTITNNFRFPGQYYDAESGLHYNYHRYYDPGTGKYVTSDPIGLNVLTDDSEMVNHLYIYVLNDPINSVDPRGLFYYKDGVPHVNLETELMLSCMDSCLGSDLGISGGGECTTPHKISNTRGHCAGKAADISFRMNPNLKNKDVMCCAKRCGFKYAQIEETHFHVQTHTGNKGGPGDLSLCNCP